jgi:hypothetical protein
MMLKFARKLRILNYVGFYIKLHSIAETQTLFNATK